MLNNISDNESETLRRKERFMRRYTIGGFFEGQQKAPERGAFRLNLRQITGDSRGC